MELPLVFIISYFVLQLPSASSQCGSGSTCDCSLARCCFRIEENRPPGTVVGRFDLGTGPYMSGSEPNAFFSINSSTGVITTLVRLDRENSFVQDTKDNNYCSVLTIVADGEPELVHIQIVDVNDNPPLFNMPSYNITVPESKNNSLTPSSCSNFEQLYGIIVTDADDEVTARTVFKIEGSSDQFILPSNSSPCVQGRGLDRDTPPSTYSFILVAEDAANSSLRSTANITFILEDINDNAPIFVSQNTSTIVYENKRSGEVVYRFEASDIDSGIRGKKGIVYSIEPPNVPFEINETTGVLTLTRQLDAEGTDEYVIEVTATDSEGGFQSMSTSMTFTIYVGDVNEPGTVRAIINSNLNVVENIAQNSSLLIATIIFEDRDETEENRRNGNYTLFTSDPGRFYLSTGVLPENGNFLFMLYLNGTFDREEESTVTVLVNVTEGGNPTLYTTETFTITVLDVNDNKPMLNKIKFNVTEGEPVQIDLSSYTYDKDNGTNGTISSYQLISVSGAGNQDFTEKFKQYFTSSGELRIPPAELDREEVGSSVFFVINITDAGTPPLSNEYSFTLTVTDINDNPPMFNSSDYTFNVPENSKVGTLVGRVVAFDRDEGSGGRVVYMLSQQGEDFSIDTTTGELRTERVFDCENESMRSRSLTVIATDDAVDGRMQSSVTVTVMIDDVNDNDPVFDNDKFKFEITVTKSVGGFVGDVSATDADCAERNKDIIYQIEGTDGSDAHFVVNTSGIITLKAPVHKSRIFNFNVSAFNPGKEENKSTIQVTVMVNPGLNRTLVIVVSATGSFFLVLIVVVMLLLIFIIWKNKKSKRQLKLHQDEDRNAQVSILKIPAANGTAGKSSRVTFKERVEETHYDGDSSVINSTTSTIKKESVTKFDSSPQVHREVEEEEECVPLSPTPHSPVISSNGKPSQLPSGIAVVELEMSPRQAMNGDINGRCQFDILSHHSPVLRVPNAAGSPRGHTTAEMLDYSQGTSSDGHISAHDMDDESMYSDDASIVNTSLSRFARPHVGIPSYETPPSHPHMELHRHLPPISHGQHTHSHSSSLAQLHAFNLAQLAKTNSTESRPRYSPMLSPDQELTPTDDTIHHTTISTQSSIHTPTAALNHMGVSANSKHQHLNGRQNFAHPLIMPDAFPHDTPDVHRFPMGSFGDYGEASTYASTELDEALGFNETEPGIISLTATDYDDDTQL